MANQKLVKVAYKGDNGKTYYDFYLAFPYKVGNVDKYFYLPLSTNYKNEKLRKVAYKTLCKNAIEVEKVY